MGDQKTATKPRQVRRLTRESSGVVTVNIRSSRILVFWSSIDLVVPIDPGWYFHAASVAGAASQVDGERRLGAGFNPADKQVRWQHAKIGSLGKVDLPLDAGSRYLFYVTPQEASRDELLQRHRPWPFVYRAPQSAEQPTMIGFLAWTFDQDCHRARETGPAPKAAQGTDPTSLSFGPVEHDSTVSAPTKDSRTVQAMIDAWAVGGLIEGGAMIDTSEPFAKWTILCPQEGSSADDPSLGPTNPYGNLTGHTSWHYVMPAFQEHGNPWTAGSLRDAIAQGRAAALTPGQAIMLGGDLFGDPNEMEKDVDRWKDPQSAMKVYWEGRNWLAAKKGKMDWTGYQQKYGVIYLVFDLLMRSPDSFDSSTVNEMVDAGKSGQYDGASEWQVAFDKLVKQAKKVDTLIDLLKEASGPSRYSEIHFLVQALGWPGGTALNWIQSRVPLIANVDIHGRLTAAGFTDKEAAYLEQRGPDSELVQIVATNGGYAKLALVNWTHFSADGLNSKTFAPIHSDALKLIAQQGKDKSAMHPIPSRAIFLTGFACHFLTDGFSASHMRVPRKLLGPFSSKLMHDVDGLVGLWVYNRPGGIEDKRNTWRAFGDGYLRGRDLSDKQKSLLKYDASSNEIIHAGNLGNLDTDPDANFEQAVFAVGSAFKQLHYQAHNVIYSAHAPEVSSPASSMVRDILDFNGPVGPDPASATELKNERLAPGSAGPGGLWDNLHMAIDERVRYVQSLMPMPYEPAESGTFRQFSNIPPLYSKSGKLNLDGTYIINDSEGPPVEGTYRGYSHYAGFTLYVMWAGFGEVDSLTLNFDKYFYMTKFFRDVQGLTEYMDKSLLDAYDKLPRVD